MYHSLTIRHACVLGFAALAFSCEQAPEQELADPVELELDSTSVREQAIARPSEFRHRYAGIQLEDGKIPVIEAKNSADGRRFSIIDRAGEEAADGGDDSVVAKLERRQLSAEERAQHAVGKAVRTKKTGRSALDPQVLEALNHVERVEVAVRFDEPLRIDVQKELGRKVALGEISNWEDYYSEKDRLKALDRAEIAAVIGPQLAEAQKQGVEVSYQCQGMYCAIVKVDQESLDGLLALSGVKKVDLLGENQPNFPDGVHVIGKRPADRVLFPSIPK